MDLARELRLAARSDRADDERVAAARRALTVPKGGEPDAWARAGSALREVAPETSAWLFRRAAQEGPVAPAALHPSVWHVAEPGPSRVLADAVRASLGRRQGQLASLAEAWPPPPFVRAVLEDEVGRVARADGSFVLAAGTQDEVRALLAQAEPVAADLDRACSVDAAEATAGLDALLARGKACLPLLLHEARRAAEGVPAGRVERCVQALTVLGLLGEREATPVLVACLESLEGWIRVTAATALGDLGDPAAAVALARQLAYAGDPFRGRESWDYPGTTETTVSPEAWPTVEYYAVDAAAADALLALGSRGAVGWLLKNDLDPRRRNVRIRVLQDAGDALVRHLPTSPAADYLPDAGLPQRHAAFERLVQWWRAHRADPDLLARRFPEQDPGWLAAAQRLADQLGKPKVLELMIAKDSCEILGGVITPVLVSTLAQARTNSHKNELAQALRRVQDPRAVPALLALLGERAGFVRASATASLGAYARAGAPEVVGALVARLEDPDCGVEVAAMQGLVAAPPSQAVRAALARNDEAAHAARCGADANYALAATVVRLVQEGEAHWPPVRDGLRSPDRVVRRTWWDLLRLALDLYEHLYDPIPEPTSPDARAIDEAAVLEALRARREGR